MQSWQLDHLSSLKVSLFFTTSILLCCYHILWEARLQRYRERSKSSNKSSGFSIVQWLNWQWVMGVLSPWAQNGYQKLYFNTKTGGKGLARFSIGKLDPKQIALNPPLNSCFNLHSRKRTKASSRWFAFTLNWTKHVPIYPTHSGNK